MDMVKVYFLKILICNTFPKTYDFKSLFKNLLSNRLEIISDTFKSNLCRILSGMNPLKILFFSTDNDKYLLTLQ